MSEPPEVTEQIALTEAEQALIRDKAPARDDTEGWEWALLERTIAALIAARVTEAAAELTRERDEAREQVGRVRAVAHEWDRSDDRAHVSNLAGELRDALDGTP